MSEITNPDLSPAAIIAEGKRMLIANPSSFPEGATVDVILIDNLKHWNSSLSREQSDIKLYQLSSKATGQLLAKLKSKRLAADRNGGGELTSKLTKEINTGRRIINESRELLEQSRQVRTHLVTMRNAVLDALRLYYTQITDKQE